MADYNHQNAFLDYHQGEAKRLREKIAACNDELRKEKHSLIRIFSEDLADLNEGGKLLRGVLVNLGYRMAGGEKAEESDALAMAFEIFQTGVLIHDDIIDHAAMRRGKPTIQKRYEERLKRRGIKMTAGGEVSSQVAEAAALCTGDLGLYYSNLMIAKSYSGCERLGDLITYFDETIIDTIRGELLDVVLPYELQDAAYSDAKWMSLLETSIRDIYHLKTACYSVIGPIHLGMMLGGASDEELEMMDRFADDVGIAYQIMDDILGVFADEGVLGKDVGSDISEFKQTILYMYVRTKAPEYTDELLNYYGKAQVMIDDLNEVRRIFQESGALQFAENEMTACFKRAEQSIEHMMFLKEKDRVILHGLVKWCRERKY